MSAVFVKERSSMNVMMWTSSTRFYNVSSMFWVQGTWTRKWHYFLGLGLSILLESRELLRTGARLRSHGGSRPHQHCCKFHRVKLQGSCLIPFLPCLNPQHRRSGYIFFPLFFPLSSFVKFTQLLFIEYPNVPGTVLC